MRALLRLTAMLWRDCKAATAVEYGLILALVILALMVGLTQLGTTTSTLWGNISTKVQNAR